MAIPNNNNPNGLLVHGRNSAAGWVTCMQLQKDAANATALFAGDACSRVNGFVTTVGIVPGTTPYQGVCLNYGAALTATDHKVITDDNALYTIQDNGVAAGVDFGRLGKNANIVLTAGNVQTGISRHQLDEATIAVGAALDLHILDLMRTPKNTFGKNARVIVKFNGHRLSTATAGL